MAQSLSRLWTHLVFLTKERYPFLSDITTRDDMHRYLATDCDRMIVRPSLSAAAPITSMPYLRSQGTTQLPVALGSH